LRFGGKVYKIEDLKIIGSLGLDFAEINLPEGGTMIYQPQDLLREAEKWGFTYLVHAPREEDPCDLNRLAGGYFQEILGLFKACRKLSCPLLNIHFWMDSRFIPEKIRDRKREILFAMAREGLRNGVQLCLENLSERPEDFQSLLSECPELGLTLDIGHAQLYSQKNHCVEFLALWPKRVKHVHAHDNLGGEGLEYDVHLPIGQGVIDFLSIMRAFVESGYQKTITLEVPLDHLESSVRQLKQIVDSLIV